MRDTRSRVPGRYLRALALALAAGLLPPAFAAEASPKRFDDEALSLTIVEAGQSPSQGIIHAMKVTERFRHPQEAATGERYLVVSTVLDVNCAEKRWRRRGYVAYGDEAGTQAVKEVPQHVGEWQAPQSPARRALIEQSCASVPVPAAPRSPPAPAPRKDRRCSVSYTEEERPFMENVCDYNTYGPVNCRNIVTRRDVIRTPHVVCE